MVPFYTTRKVAGRATEPVQLGHHQDVPVPDRTQRRGEPRPLPVASGPTPIGVQMLVRLPSERGGDGGEPDAVSLTAPDERPATEGAGVSLRFW